MKSPLIFSSFVWQTQRQGNLMRLGCTQPLTTFAEKRVQTEILIQLFTASGMRKHMQTCDGQGIIARDECQRFLKDIIAENEKDSLDITMLVLFHDNSPWFFNLGREEAEVH